MDLAAPPPQYWWQAERWLKGAWQHTLGKFSNPIPLLEPRTTPLGFSSLRLAVTQRAQPCCERTVLWRRPQKDDLERGGEKWDIPIGQNLLSPFFFSHNWLIGDRKKSQKGMKPNPSAGQVEQKSRPHSRRQRSFLFVNRWRADDVRLARYSRCAPRQPTRWGVFGKTHDLWPSAGTLSTQFHYRKEAFAFWGSFHPKLIVHLPFS